ncbi:MAG: uracil-DNA glycosylase [Pirellulaceae bacterium]|nr:uracil-DNA glycosylase [Pirellulaceae bacterium]
MTTRDSDEQSLDANTVLAQSAALAQHLQRSGISFLPAADPQAVETLQPRFRTVQIATPPESIQQASESTQKQSASTANRESDRGPSERAAARSAPPSVVAPRSSGEKGASGPIVTDMIEASYEGAALSPEQRVTSLQTLAAQVATCVRCDKLAACRTNTVFGEGSVTPRVAFFGEGPGADEDRTGRPFVGKAGQLLTKMIEACSFAREDVYIFNAVKCRPPGNRNPEPDELANCREYFQQQLQLLRPEYIVCLGAVSSQTLLQSKLSVGRLRGKFYRYFDSKVLVTYHPAYLLRNPAAKKAAWQDLQLMLRDAGITP